MEMHLNSIVVSLLDSQGKAFREYEPKLKDNSRRCNMFMPFDSEYKILVKNQSQGRVRMEVDIDGTGVSGRGIIIPSGSTETLERFVDVAKKFKFVKAVGPGANPDVADPTNPENGIVKVRVYEERPYVNFFGIDSKLNSWNRNGGIINPITWSNTTMVGSNMTVSYSSTASDILTSKSIGATVEGGKSDQEFYSTSWNGDKDSPRTFTFYIQGTDSLESDPDYKEYLRLKNKFGH